MICSSNPLWWWFVKRIFSVYSIVYCFPLFLSIALWKAYIRSIFFLYCRYVWLYCYNFWRVWKCMLQSDNILSLWCRIIVWKLFEMLEFWYFFFVYFFIGLKILFKITNSIIILVTYSTFSIRFISIFLCTYSAYPKRIKSDDNLNKHTKNITL